MTNPPVQPLTPDEADLLAGWHHAGALAHKFEAIRDGHHVVIERVTEAEAREAFETWFTEHDSRTTKDRAIERNPSGTYRLIAAETAWGTWLAALRWAGKIEDNQS